MSEPEIVNIYNSYCVNNKDPQLIYSMTELDDQLAGDTPTNIILKATGGDRFNIGDSYFYFDGYDNINTFSHIQETTCPIDIDAIAKYILEYEVTFGYNRISDKLDDYRFELHSEEDE